MAIKISLDHPTFTLKEKVQKITKEFFATFGFNYFQYLRCFDDGSIGLLTNDTRLIEYMDYIDNSPIVFSSFESEHKNSHSYWFMWDEALPEFPVQLAREKFNIRNGLTLVRRARNYYDMIAVALPQEQNYPGSFYLNKLTAIEQFVMEFDRQNRDIIELINHHPLLLPKPYRDINYEKICLNKGKINVLGKKHSTYVTPQELACLRLLIQHYSYKEIARFLEISPRTVETYLQRAKLRTQLSTIKEIEKMISFYPTL